MLQRDASLTLDMQLSSIAEWDSLAAMILMAFLQSQFSLRLPLDEIRKMRTVADIADAAGLAP
jgi:acyl carrier protein